MCTSIRCLGCYISNITGSKAIGSKIGNSCANYEDSTYLELCENYPAIHDTTLDLLTSIEEVGKIHDISNKVLANFKSPRDLLTLVHKLNPVELRGGEATLTKTPLGYVKTLQIHTQPSSQSSPFVKVPQAPDSPPPIFRKNKTKTTCISSKIDLTKDRLTASDDMLFGINEGWVHQNPGTHLDGVIEEDCKWQKEMVKSNLFAHPML